MIIDHLKHASQYLGGDKRLSAALRYLQDTDLASVPPGKYEIDGSDVFAIVQEYDSKPKEKGYWEAHRQYIDVQYVARGAELMGYAHLDRLKSGQYDETRDFLPLEGEGNFFEVREGTFVILSSQDAHMPGIAVTVPQPVKKVVVKVRMPDRSA